LTYHSVVVLVAVSTEQAVPLHEQCLELGNNTKGQKLFKLGTVN